MTLLAAAFALNAATVTPSPTPATVPCDHSAGALNRYEQILLNRASELKTAADTAKIEEPLRCLFELQQNGQGLAKYLAQKYLNPLMGAGQIPGVPLDPRYRELTRYLERMTLQTSDPLLRSVVAEYAKGDWGFYQLFCEQGDVSFCTTFLPDETQVKQDPPLLAAASLLRLRKAYQVTSGKQREEIAQRLRTLYRDIPASAKLQRRFIDQIYNELFLSRPLGMA